LKCFSDQFPAVLELAGREYGVSNVGRLDAESHQLVSAGTVHIRCREYERAVALATELAALDQVCLHLFERDALLVPARSRYEHILNILPEGVMLFQVNNRGRLAALIIADEFQSCLYFSSYNPSRSSSVLSEKYIA